MGNRDGSALPAWRRRVMPWMMRALRAAMVWDIFRGPTVFLWSPPALLHLPLLGRAVYAVLLVAGAPLFVGSRFCTVGGCLLVLAVGCYEWLWRHAGLPPGGMPWLAVALLAVLVSAEHITRAAQRRIYGPDASAG
jgi:hypothetical protein